MREVLTVIGPTPDAPTAAFPFAVREWCINTAAVNPATKSIFVPNEDGRIYRWNLATNSLSQVVALTQGFGEPYVPTIIGPDGTVFTLERRDAVCRRHERRRRPHDDLVQTRHEDRPGRRIADVHRERRRGEAWCGGLQEARWCSRTRDHPIGSPHPSHRSSRARRLWTARARSPPRTCVPGLTYYRNTRAVGSVGHAGADRPLVANCRRRADCRGRQAASLLLAPHASGPAPLRRSGSPCG